MESDCGQPLRPLLLGMGWPSGQPGGLNRYLAAFYSALESAGAKPAAVVLGPAPDAPSGVTVAADVAASLARRLIAYARAARAPADILDAHFALYALPVALLRRSDPLAFPAPGAGAYALWAAGRTVGTLLRRRWERLLYRRADRLVTLSAAFKRLLVERYGIAPWMVEVVPPGVDLVRFSPEDPVGARVRLDLPSRAWIGVTARRLVPRMGLGVLLEAWASLPANALLLIVGDGPERTALEARAREQDLAGRVRFVGRVDDATLVDCYCAADVCVVPSLALEGYGLVVLEALACGTPVVTSDAGGLPEASVLDPGLVVPAGDATALAERLVAARTGARPLPSAERCREHAERHSWARVARRHVDLYRCVVEDERKRFRVVYVDHTARLGGAELALLRLLPALKHVDAHVILAEDGPLVERLREVGISVEVLPLAARTRELRRARTTPGFALALPSLDAGLYALRLAWRLRHLRPDLVHTNSLKAALYGGVAGLMARVPVVWHVRDRIANDYLPPASASAVRHAARIVPSAVVANSASTLASLGLLSQPAAVVGSPVHIAPAEHKRGDRAFRVGIVGRIAPWKGQHLFLDAFARAFPDGEERAAVVGAPLFGEHDYEEELHAQAQRLGIAGRVDFRGFVEDIATELRSLDVLVHASLIPEPFGQVVVEGLAAGTPVVAANAGGPTEILSDGVDGLLYDAGDADALAAALVRLASDPDLRLVLARRGRERARDYTPARIARDLEAFYQGVLENR